MTQDEIIRMACQSGLGWVAHKRLERFASLVAEHERKTISKKFWSAMNSCVTTDELGVEFIRKFYPVHDFGHRLDGCDK